MINRPKKIILGLLIVSSTGLAGLWLRAHTTQNTLQQTIAKARADLDKTNRRAGEDQSRIAELNSEIAEKKKSLDEAPAAAEAKRRAAALDLIGRLKREHEKNPPAPRQKQPPSGSSGFFFPELLSDPEYNQLYAQQTRRTIKLMEGGKLRELGLSPEACEKAISILAEQQMAFTDYRQLTGNAGIKGDFYKQQTEATDRQLQELMGEEAFQRWKAMNETKTVFVPNATGTGGRGYGMQSHEALVYEANSYLMPKLATRLSYSDAPLQKEQAQQLAEILATFAATPGNPVYKAMYTEAFIEQAAQVLSPTQVQALREFQAEQQASTKRAKLPKSSELPRNSP